jgi:hypothetical protein
MPSTQSTTIRRLFARATTLLFVGVLLCVPGLTRVGQRIATSQAPTLSFSKSTECPPKRIDGVRVADVRADFFADDAPPCTAAARWTPAVHVPLSPAVFCPRPLRAPPSTSLS